MKLSLFVDYNTVWGETLSVELAHGPSGGDMPEVLPMTMIQGTSIWHVEIAVTDLRTLAGVEYTYMVILPDGRVARREWRGHTVPHADVSTARLDLFDAWCDRPAELPYLSTLFTDCVFRRDESAKNEARLPAPGMLTLQATAPIVPADCVLAVAGSIPALGEWNPDKAVRMADSAYPVWQAAFVLPPEVTSFEYKFLVVKRESGEVVSWEPRSNRRFVLPYPLNGGEALVVSGLAVHAPFPLWRGAGVQFPYSRFVPQRISE
ncbi:MAG: hypothetical protein K2O27_08385 [Candidatus Amulumruptor sp.]|nr:hypothetical protein [Candidatus Amulumruptor sp.]